MREMEVGYFPKHVEFGGKLIELDTMYASRCRGITKIFCIALCFLAIVLVCASQPVQDERGPALFFCFLGIIGSFAILLEYTFMLNTRLSTNFAFILEATFYVLVAVGLFVSAIFMLVFCAIHWSDMNPEWATMPSLASAALFLCSALYVIEVGLLVSDARQSSWRPPSLIDRPVTTVLPQ